MPDTHTPELTPELLNKIRDHINNDLPIGSTTAKEWLRAMLPAVHDRDNLRVELERYEEWRQTATLNVGELIDEHEQIKAERDDYRKVLEWYGGGSEDGGEKARDVILRYKRGDGADGQSD